MAAENGDGKVLQILEGLLPVGKGEGIWVNKTPDVLVLPWG